MLSGEIVEVAVLQEDVSRLITRFPELVPHGLHGAEAVGHADGAFTNAIHLLPVISPLGDAGKMHDRRCSSAESSSDHRPRCPTRHFLGGSTDKTRPHLSSEEDGRVSMRRERCPTKLDPGAPMKSRIKDARIQFGELFCLLSSFGGFASCFPQPSAFASGRNNSE